MVGRPGLDSRVVVKAHFGRAVAGPFGRDGRFDVIGAEVNVAAVLPARTVSVSAEAFRCLENGERRAYKKHTAPVVYIPWTIRARDPVGRGRAPCASPSAIVRAMSERPLPRWLAWAADPEQLRRAPFLARSPLFAGLPRRLLARLATRFLEKIYHPGEVVFEEGDPGRALFVVVEGAWRSPGRRRRARTS